MTTGATSDHRDGYFIIIPDTSVVYSMKVLLTADVTDVGFLDSYNNTLSDYNYYDIVYNDYVCKLVNIINTISYDNTIFGDYVCVLQNTTQQSTLAIDIKYIGVSGLTNGLSGSYLINLVENTMITYEMDDFKTFILDNGILSFNMSNLEYLESSVIRPQIRRYKINYGSWIDNTNNTDTILYNLSGDTIIYFELYRDYGIPVTTTTTTIIIPTDICDPTHLYTWVAVGDGTYYREVITSAIPPTAPLTLSKADGFGTYSQLGTRVINNSFGTMEILPFNTLWKNISNNLIDGPLNRTGIWTTTFTGSGATKIMTPLDKWIGFSVCLTGLEVGKTYYVGIAGDNDYRLVLDNNVILDTYAYAINVNSFQYWNLFPIVIGGGDHTLELYGLNRTTGSLPNLAAFGCEIYDNTIVELRNATVLGDLNIVFSASAQTVATVVQNIDGTYDSLGYSCSSGSVYSICSGGNCIQKIYCP